MEVGIVVTPVEEAMRLVCRRTLGGLGHAMVEAVCIAEAG
jgi:hypothetical protein